MESWRFCNIGSRLYCLYANWFHGMLLKEERHSQRRQGYFFLYGLPTATIKSICKERSIRLVSCVFLGDGSKDRGIDSEVCYYDGNTETFS